MASTKRVFLKLFEGGDALNTWFLKTLFNSCSSLAIISCSEKAIQSHIAAGYKNAFYLIPNGVDIEEFKNLSQNSDFDLLDLENYISGYNYSKGKKVEIGIHSIIFK